MNLREASLLANTMNRREEADDHLHVVQHLRNHRDAFPRSNLPPPPAHSASGSSSLDTSSSVKIESVSSKSRRKPKNTVRILTNEHNEQRIVNSDRHRYMMDSQTMQTQPLNMSVRTTRSYASADGALDLSSRSKSDAESDTEVEMKYEDDYHEDDHMDDEDHDEEDDHTDPQDLSRRTNNNSSSNSNNGFHPSYRKEILRS